MGLMQQAYDTYCAMESQYAGIYGKAEGAAGSCFAPNRKCRAGAHSGRGRSSAGRPFRRGGAGRHDHPCDGEFLGANRQSRRRTPSVRPDPVSLPAVSRQIRKLPDTAAPLGAITLRPPQALRHRPLCGKGTIAADMAQRGLIALDEKGFPVKEKQIVRWRVETGGENETPACWQDQSLFQAFIDYYASTKSEKPAFCMVTGKTPRPPASTPRRSSTCAPTPS